MKIARRKRAQAGTGCFNPGDAKSASRTRLNQFSAGYFLAGCQPFGLSRRIAWMNPSQKAARRGQLLIKALMNLVSAYICTRSRRLILDLGATAVCMTVLLSLLKARATSALDYLEQKLIYISQIDIHVKTCYTITDEKNSSDYLIPRNVRWRVWQFDDVEGAERRLC